ncbi:PDR/VanB family oxidoreductase [Marinomonas sp.]|uniref:PDR/VanB family oxidoreductase n=1 Tax=Marinomonas sp. TaxID=1904862 RepID=UPI003BAC626F
MMKKDKYQVRVQSLHWECEGVISIVLVPLEGELPEADAGAHIDVIQADAPTRQYSLTAGSSNQQYVLGVRLDPNSRGGSLAIHNTWRPGSMVTISSPRNAFPLVENGPVHLIAGGIGITPILMMAHVLSTTEREWSLSYYVRSRKDAPFLKEVEDLGGKICCNDVDGRPDLAQDIQAYSSTTHLYCCGPASMLDAFIEVCRDRPSEFVHIERFAAPQVQVGAGAFVVELRQSAQTFVVPADQSILETLLSAGMSPNHNCCSGICGECEVTVLEGEVDHQDGILSDDEKASGVMLLCCSRSKTDKLVLDL